MPRIGRLHVPGGCYHVMGRGLERRAIFDSNSDKQDFIQRLAQRVTRERSFTCLAWAVMPNHYHLLIRVGDEPLSRLMGRLLSGYATAYNRRHGRAGYVFQNRFRSILCEEDAYLLTLVRYIHLNPIRAGIVEGIDRLDNYPWTGHATLMGRLQNNWQSCEPVFERFGQTERDSRRRYRLFLCEGKRAPVDYSGGGLIRSYGGWDNIANRRVEHERKIGDERILGSSEFVANVIANDQIKPIPAIGYARNGWNLERLVNALCHRFQINVDDITRRGRENAISEARAVICSVAIDDLHIKCSEIAARLKLSRTGVTTAADRGRRLCKQRSIRFTDLLNV